MNIVSEEGKDLNTRLVDREQEILELNQTLRDKEEELLSKVRAPASPRLENKIIVKPISDPL